MSEDIKELVKRLREEADHQHNLAHDCDCAPEVTANWVAMLNIRSAADALEAMAGEVASLQNTFDLMWKADQRAIKLWHEATGKDHIWPDRTKTTLWLLERAEAAESERDRLKAAITTHVAGCVACGGGGVVVLCPERDDTAEAVSEDCEECVGLRKALGGDA